MGARVLIVDDDRELSEALRTGLARHYEVMTAGDVPAALVLLDTVPVDVMLLDVILPKGTGFDVLDTLARRSGARPRVIVMSALSTEIDLAPYAHLVAGTLSKPFGLQSVEAEVRNALAGAATQDAAPATGTGDASVLLVDDDTELREAMADVLRRFGYRVTTAPALAEAEALLRSQAFEIIVSDWIMPGGTGAELLERAKALAPGVPVLLVTAHGTPDFSRRMLSAGAADVLLKPFPPKALPAAVEKCLHGRPAAASAMAKRAATAGAGGSTRYSAADIVGESPAIRVAKEALRRAALLDSNVLVRGETGTGKELFAQALHAMSARAHAPFVAVNAAAIPDSLLESELFGYTGGAFTGARKEGRQGKFQLAHGGTLFLDEIGDLSLLLQAKLLRVLQECELDVVGGGTHRVDVRVIAATHRNLETMVGEGTFRSDLYYRLNVVTLELPPLRERAGDTARLAGRFLRELAKRYDRQGAGFSPGALALMERYAWPGNIRELQNVVEQAFAFAGGALIEPEHLPPALRTAAPGAAAPPLPGQPLDLAGRERAAIIRALESTNGNKVQAAKLLGISRAGLYIKLKVYDLV